MVTKVNQTRDNVEHLLGQGIGVSENAGSGFDGGLMQAFAQSPRPIFCLLGESEMPTPEEILFIRAYQEFMVVDRGYKTEDVDRREGIAFIPGAITEVWCKGGYNSDGKWRYRSVQWTQGPFTVPIEGCNTIQELPNVVDKILWNDTFRQNMAVIFPAIVELDKHWDLEFKASKDGGIQIWIEQRTLIQAINHQIIVFDDATKDRREFDIANPNCYNDIVTFTRNLRK